MRWANLCVFETQCMEFAGICANWNCSATNVFHSLFTFWGVTRCTAVWKAYLVVFPCGLSQEAWSFFSSFCTPQYLGLYVKIHLCDIVLWYGILIWYCDWYFVWSKHSKFITLVALDHMYIYFPFVTFCWLWFWWYWVFLAVLVPNE